MIALKDGNFSTPWAPDSLVPDDLIAMFDLMSNGITVQDATGRLVYVNPVAAGMLGSRHLADLRSCQPALALIREIAVGISSVPIELLPGCRALRGEKNPTALLTTRGHGAGNPSSFKLHARPIRSPDNRVSYAVTTWVETDDQSSILKRDRGLAAIVLTSDDAIVSKTLDGTVTSWNPAAEMLFGWAAAEMLGHSIQRIVPPEKRSDLENILSKLGRGERIDHHETVRLARNGRRIDVSVNISPFVNDDGLIIGAAKICRDVTARKRTEAGQRLLAAAGNALSTSLNLEATLEALTHIAVGPLADAAAAYLVQSDGEFVQIAGAQHESMSTLGPCGMFEDDQGMSLIRGAFNSGRATLGSPADTSRIADDDDAGHRNDQKPYESSHSMAVPLTARGQLLGVLAFHVTTPRRPFDCDDLDLASELARWAAIAIDNALLCAEARSADKRYRALFGGGAAGVVVVNADGRYLDANDAALRMLGRTLAELRTLRIGDGTVGSSDELNVWISLRRDGTWHGELDIRRPDNETVPIEAHAEEVELSGDTVYLIQWLDITARKASERFEDTFLADLAHDLNNPLASMRIQAQLMQRRLMKGVLDERVTKDGLSAIEASTGRMARRINELADIARLCLGGVLELRPEEFDLISLIQELRMAHQQTTDRHVVTLQSSASQLIVNWDRWRLERVFDNLFANAIKYSPAGGVVSIGLALEETSQGAGACLAVADQGVGIPASDLPFVLDRFRRGSNVMGRFAGAGIGLSEAKQIVEQHGGKIELFSEVGRGTTVKVRLPLAPVTVQNPDQLEIVV